MPVAAYASEAELLSALKQGNERAYEVMVITHGGRMLAVAKRMLGNEEEARDALQEAFIQAFRGLARFEGNSQLGTWLHRIVVNAALMRMRTRRSRPEESIEDLLPRFQDDGHTREHYEDWADTPQRMLESKQVRHLVRASIERLPETHRTVLVLRDIEELSTAEVAELLGISENAVKIRLHRARQALREQLDPGLRKAS